MQSTQLLAIAIMTFGYKFEGHHYQQICLRATCRLLSVSFWLGEWTDSSSDEKAMEVERPTNKLKLSTSHAQNPCMQFISKDQEGTLSKKYVPKNMVSSMKWARANFTLWKKARNEQCADIQ